MAERGPYAHNGCGVVVVQKACVVVHHCTNTLKSCILYLLYWWHVAWGWGSLLPATTCRDTVLRAVRGGGVFLDVCHVNQRQAQTPPWRRKPFYHW